MTAFLVDTQLLVWAADEPERLSARAIEILSDPANALNMSLVSFWELSIKFRLGRSDFDVPPWELRSLWLQRGLDEIAIKPAHVFAVAGLPLLHRDPFDRLLVVTARVEGLTLLTADTQLPAYSADIILV